MKKFYWKLRMAWHILQGKPLVYGIRGEVYIKSTKDTWVIDCSHGHPIRAEWQEGERPYPVEYTCCKVITELG